MLPMLQKHTVIMAALVASLSLTACGSKKEVFGPPPEATKTNNTNGKIGGGLPDPSDIDNARGDESYDSEDAEYAKPPGPVPSGPSNSRPSPPPTVVDTKPAPSPAARSLPSDYNPIDARNVSREGVTKRLTGGITSDGLVYTSTATDELLDYLRARNERVGYETRRLNLQAAASVVSAKIGFDSLTSDATVTLKVSENGTVYTYNVAGSAEPGSANVLKSVRAGNNERTTGQRALEGTLKCVDFDGGCENIFVRLKIGSSPSSAIINVVFRYSSADVYFNLPGEYSNNPEYLTMREFMINTIQGKNTDNRIKTVRMNSWEVVNGRSGVTLSMKGRNNELLAFAGPLLAPEAGTRVNIPMSRISQDKEDTLDIISLNNTKLNYANWIGEARLRANNGLGQVQVALKMRKRGHYAQDQFAVTFMRKIKPLVELTDDNLN